MERSVWNTAKSWTGSCQLHLAHSIPRWTSPPLLWRNFVQSFNVSFTFNHPSWWAVKWLVPQSCSQVPCVRRWNQVSSKSQVSLWLTLASLLKVAPLTDREQPATLLRGRLSLLFHRIFWVAPCRFRLPISRGRTATDTPPNLLTCFAGRLSANRLHVPLASKHGLIRIRHTAQTDEWFLGFLFHFFAGATLRCSKTAGQHWKHVWHGYLWHNDWEQRREDTQHAAEVRKGKWAVPLHGLSQATKTDWRRPWPITAVDSRRCEVFCYWKLWCQRMHQHRRWQKRGARVSQAKQTRHESDLSRREHHSAKKMFLRERDCIGSDDASKRGSNRHLRATTLGIFLRILLMEQQRRVGAETAQYQENTSCEPLNKCNRTAGYDAVGPPWSLEGGRDGNGGTQGRTLREVSPQACTLRASGQDRKTRRIWEELKSAAEGRPERECNFCTGSTDMDQHSSGKSVSAESTDTDGATRAWNYQPSRSTTSSWSWAGYHISSWSGRRR